MMLSVNDELINEKTGENAFFPALSFLRRSYRKPCGPGEEKVIPAEQKHATGWRCSMPLEKVP
jgi:hypothetical protein